MYFVTHKIEWEFDLNIVLNILDLSETVYEMWQSQPLGRIKEQGNQYRFVRIKECCSMRVIGSTKPSIEQLYWTVILHSYIAQLLENV